MDSNVKPEAKVAKKKKKVRNPRITVCYSPEDYATILEESAKAVESRRASIFMTSRLK